MFTEGFAAGDCLGFGRVSLGWYFSYIHWVLPPKNAIAATLIGLITSAFHLHPQEGKTGTVVLFLLLCIMLLKIPNVSRLQIQFLVTAHLQDTNSQGVQGRTNTST